MRRLTLFVLISIAVAPAMAQRYVTPKQLSTTDLAGVIRVVSADPDGNACTATTPETIQRYVTAGAVTDYACTSSTWSKIDYTTAAGKQFGNAQIVTVCLTGACDFVTTATNAHTTIQSILDDSDYFGTAANPVVILLLPGAYTANGAIAFDPDNNDYTHLMGYSPELTSLVNASADAFLDYDVESGSFDDVSIRNITVGSTGGGKTVELVGLTNDTRFTMTIDNVTLACGDGSNCVDGDAGNVAAPTLRSSELHINDTRFEFAANALVIDNNVSAWITDTTFEATAGTRTGSSNPHGAIDSTSHFTNTLVYISGVTIYVESDVAKTSPDSYELVWGIRSDGTANMVIVGSHIEVGFDPAVTTTADGAAIVVTGQGSGQSNIEINDTTLVYGTNHANQTMAGVFLGPAPSQVTMRNVAIQRAYGPGTEYDLGFDQQLAACGWIESAYGSANDYEKPRILLNNTSYTTTLNAYDCPIRNEITKLATVDMHPAVVTLNASSDAALHADGDYIAFDAATNESAIWRQHRVTDLYDKFAAVAPRARVRWKAASATSGDAIWKVGFCVMGEDDAWPCTVSSFSSVTDTALGTAGDLLITAWVDLPSGLVAGESVIFEIERDAAAGGDTMAGDAHLINAEIQYGVK